MDSSLKGKPWASRPFRLQCCSHLTGAEHNSRMSASPDPWENQRGGREDSSIHASIPFSRAFLRWSRYRCGVLNQDLLVLILLDLLEFVVPEKLQGAIVEQHLESQVRGVAPPPTDRAHPPHF